MQSRKRESAAPPAHGYTVIANCALVEERSAERASFAGAERGRIPERPESARVIFGGRYRPERGQKPLISHSIRAEKVIEGLGESDAVLHGLEEACLARHGHEEFKACESL